MRNEVYNWDMSRLFREGEIVNIIESVLNRLYVLFVALLFWLIEPEASEPEASEPVSVYGLTVTDGWD